MKCKGETSYFTCAPKEQQLVCGVSRNPEDTACREGCYCPPGRAMKGNRCVAISQCPCIFNGKEHKAGDVITQECYPCSCVNGGWKCNVVRKLAVIEMDPN